MKKTKNSEKEENNLHFNKDANFTINSDNMMQNKNKIILKDIEIENLNSLIESESLEEFYDDKIRASKNDKNLDDFIPDDDFFSPDSVY